MIALLLAAALALGGTLTLDEVMASVDARIPALAAAEAQLDEAEAKLLASRGAFDPVLQAHASAYTGPYPRSTAEASVGANTPLGPSVEAGWRRGVGDFPTYDPRYTADDGELRATLRLPLLEGLGAGEGRTALQDSRLGIQAAGAALDDKRVQIRRKAAEAWWKWVAQGAKLEVAQTQLELAEKRARALEREVEQGARAPIEQLDNERVLFERRSDLARARQELGVSALVLSLWLRDDAGAPRVPQPDELPGLELPEIAPSDVDSDVQRALERPDVREAVAAVLRSEVSVARGRNQVLPRLDGKLEARQDLTDEPLEWIAGASLELPVLLRKGRGERDRAEAALERDQQVLRQLRDQVRADVAAAHLALEATSERTDWAVRASERARQVLELERRSWELGASDLFVLLQREDALAKARKAAIDAQLELALAEVALQAVIGAGS